MTKRTKKPPFQERLVDCLHKYGHRTAVEYGDRTLSYSELNRRSDRVSHSLLQNGIEPGRFIGIYLEDRIDLIVTVTGILKARCVFVVLDTVLPLKRIDGMCRTARLEFVFTDETNKGKLQGPREFIVDDALFQKEEIENDIANDIGYSREDRIYVYFTSGSTGTPKAIVGKNKGLLNFIDWEIGAFGIDESCRISQLTTPGFDAFLRDVFVPLCSGGTVCIPGDKEILTSRDSLIRWIDRGRVDLIHCVPSLFRLFNSDALSRENYKSLKYVLLSGEKIAPSELKKWYGIFGERIQLANLYGPTETTMIKTCYFIRETDVRRAIIPVGKPIKGSRILILDGDMKPCGTEFPGEIYIRTPFMTFGYYNDPRAHEERFIPNPFTGDPDDLLYKTGDLGRVLADGNIELIGRIDRQVKIRGVRVELEEIENVLLNYTPVDEAVVLEKQGAGGDRYLCAYIAASREIAAGELREYLAGELPAYTIPSVFVPVERMPLTANGKINIKALPEPGLEDVYIAPGDKIEKKLAEIWSGVLKIPEGDIGIETDFFKVGGNSLNGVILLSNIHNVFNVKIHLRTFFEGPTIRGLRGHIGGAAEDRYESIEPVEKKEYYILSPAQKRLYILQQMELKSKSYNVPRVMPLDRGVRIEGAAETFGKLIERHEGLRTSFEIVDEEPVQRIHEGVPFNVERYDTGDGRTVEAVVESFVRPFDLSRAPLLRVGVVETAGGENVLLLDMHHIVSDAVSQELLEKEFIRLYSGEELEPNKIGYKDYAEWQNNVKQRELRERQEAYWVELYSGELPVLNLPLDFPRPRMQSFEGAAIYFELDGKESARLKELAVENNVTLYMVLLSAVNILLWILSGQEDIIVGTPVSGRPHRDLAGIVGMFVNTLPMRSYPSGNKSYKEFLLETKERALEFFENREYQFEDLVERISAGRDTGRNPVFDVVFNMLNMAENGDRVREQAPTGLDDGIEPKNHAYKKATSQFDINLAAFETGEKMCFNLEYCTKLFEPGTIERFIDLFKQIVSAIAQGPDPSLSDIESAVGPPLEFPPVTAAPASGAAGIPASYHQERIWFIDAFESGYLYESGPVYHNIPLLLDLKGDIDVPRLEKSIRDTIMRHEVLRTRIYTVEDKPFQRVSGEQDFRLTLSDVTGNGGSDSRGKAVSAALRETALPFLMDKDPLIRGTLIRYGNREFILSIVLHHAVADRYSTRIVARDLLSYYREYLENRTPRFSPPPIHYKDFSQWQRELPPRLYNYLSAYWKNKLGGKLQALDLPVDRPRAVIHTYRGERRRFEIPGDLCKKISAYGKREDTGHLVTLLAAFKVLLYRYAGHEEIVVGTGADNRSPGEAGTVAGPIANLVVLRSWIDGADGFGSFTAGLKRTVNEAFKYRHMPFDRLVLELAPGKDMGRTALFDVLFQYEDESASIPMPQIKNLETAILETNLGWGKYDLNLSVQKRGETFSGVLVYNSDYYDDSTISRMTGHYLELLNCALGDPSRPVSQLSLLSGGEKERVLDMLNVEPAGYPGHKTVHRLFREQAARTPDGTAVVFKDRQLTYNALDEKSDRLAGALERNGVRPGTIVGLMVERSMEMIVAILAVLKSGGAYLPMDPLYPDERIEYMLGDSGVEVLLLQGAFDGRVPRTGGLNRLHIGDTDLYDTPAAGLNEKSTAHDPAYIIYTSGTTGEPRGAMIEHRNLVSLMCHDNFLFDFNGRDVWTMFHSYGFDFSVWEMYGALLYGGKLVVVPGIVAKDPGGFLELLTRESVTVLNQTPTAFYNLSRYETPDTPALYLRYIIFGGEALHPLKLKEWKHKYPGTKTINMYGITETTVHVTYKEITAKEIESNISNIGKPIPTLAAYVMDGNLNVLPIGVPGEMCVGGPGVCRGYVGRARLTAEKFVDNPYRAGEKLYKSGDLVKLSGNGDLQYLGRIDHQVKIRGFRIELGEIESQLLKHGKIKEAAVLLREDKKGDKYLCAYTSAGAVREIPGAGDLRKYLSLRLPDYMIPSYFVKMKRFPLTSNGKINRKLLPEPELKADDGYRAPGNKIEETLVEIWAGVLGIERDAVGIDSDFFELGGHSLKATVLVSKIHKELNVKLPLAEVFKNPTVKGLAGCIADMAEERYSSIEPVEKKEYYPLSSAQKRLYILQQMDPGSTVYNILELFPLEEAPDTVKLKETFIKLIHRHESLRTSMGMVEEEPVQRIHDTVAFEIERPGMGGGLTDAVKNFIRPFDLSRPPLFRAGLAKTGESAHWLIVDMHHIVSDEISHGILVKDYTALYGGRELAPLRVQYKDFSEWQNSGKEKSAIMRQEEYWLGEFEGKVPLLNMPLDYERPGEFGFEGSSHFFSIDRDLTAGVRAFTSQSGVTTMMFLIAVYKILLSKYTGQEEIVVGTVIAGRRHADLQKVIGFFINMLAVRTAPGGDKTFSQYLGEVKEKAVYAYENQDYPFEELVGKLQIEREPGRHPLIDTIFVLHNVEGVSEGPGENAGPADGDLDTHLFKKSHFDLMLSAAAADDKITMHIEYSTALFKQETIEKFSTYYMDILEQVVENKDIRLNDITVTHGLLVPTAGFVREDDDDWDL